MPGIIAFPTIVEKAVDELGWMIANTPERWHFAEYLTGLMVAERKNVSSGRQATSGHGGRSVTHGQGPDPAPESGDADAQSPHGPDRTGPCA